MSLRYRSVIFVALFSCCSSIFAAETYKVQINATAEIKDFLSQYLDLVTQENAPDIDEEQVDSMVAKTPEQAEKLLKTEGYFQSKVNLSKQGNTWVISVTAGNPIMVNEVIISIDGAIRKDSRYKQRLALANQAWTLPIGQRFRQEDWEKSKKNALRSITSNSYPLAKITESRALINPDTKTAILIINFDSGAEIRFGELKIQGNNRYPQSIATGMADFGQGSDYDQQKLLNYQSRLEQDQHYSGAVVIPDFSNIKNGSVPITVQLTEQPRQKLEFGLSYDTFEGPGVRINYEHYNVFKHGYTGSIFADIKNDDKKVSVGLALPRKADHYSHNANITYEKSNIQNLLTESRSAGIWRMREHDNIRSQIGIKYLSETSEIGSNHDQRKGHALLGSFTWSQKEVNNLMHPQSGYLFDTSLSATPGKIASSTGIIRARIHGNAYSTPFASKYGTLVGRIELGQVWSKNANLVPESLLFRTGGSSSIRGYENQSLGIKDGDAVRGGSVLAIASIEYQVPIFNEWSAAAFYDTGNATDKWSSFRTASSYGIGARWFSPIAPLSIDIARAIQDKRWRLNLSVGLTF